MALPNYSPQGHVYLGCVPWDNSYKHVRLYDNLTQQINDIRSKMQTTLDTDGYVYVGRDRALKVSLPADRLYHINYCMYQNTNVSGQWIFCFVTDVRYINDNTTMLVLETDIFQTYLHGVDWEVPACFVERECVDDDTPGKHLNPEPSMQIDYETENIANYYNYGRYVVLMVNAYPAYDYSKDAGKGVGNTPESGDVYQGQYNACKFLVYDTMKPESLEKLKVDIKGYNAVGAADTICDAFMCSTYTLPVDDDGGYPQMETFVDWTGDPSHTLGKVWQVKGGTEAPKHQIFINRATSFGGYVPKNNKLFVYPYSYAEVGDWTGRVTDYRYEFVDNPADRAAGRVRLEHCTPINAELTTYIIPIDYNGCDGDTSPEVFTADMSNKVSWVYSAYQNWAAQNASTNALALASSVGTMAFSVMPGINAAAKILNSPAAKNFPRLVQREAGLGFREEASEKGLAAGGLGALGTLANIDRMSKVPNTAKGNVGGNAKFQMDKAGFYTRSVRLIREYAEIIDSFFSMFGYQVDEVKEPDIDSRPYWNYVKTDGCCARSTNVAAGANAPFSRGHGTPSEALSVIRQCFDSGITFWHTTAGFGDYSLDNTL